MSKVRVRFAPSPTGFVHVGSLRTTLYNYLFARKNSGTFILRVEDTDRKRFVEGAVENLIKTLDWAGLDHDEGVFLEEGKVVQRGNYGPYFQSERLEIYKKYAEELLAKGHAYHCFCSPEKLDEMRAQQLAAKKAPMYDRTCLNLSSAEVAEKLKAGGTHVIRQKINTEGVTEFDDIIRGKVKFENALLDDQVIMKSDGFPTYNFANVIDDHLMEITHAIRGEEFVSSTPKYIQLYQAFGWEAPQFAHLPLLLNPDKSKLSKRQGDVAVEDYVKKGYSKEALLNFVALLGWNPGEGSTQEIFTLPELIEKFDLARVHKAGAVFDLKKLDWINAQYIKKLSVDELYAASLEFWQTKDFYQNAAVEKKSPEYLKKVLTIEQERLTTLTGVGEDNQFFFKSISAAPELLRWKNMTDDDLKQSLESAKSIFENIIEANWTKENIEKLLLEKAGDKRGELLWPIRAALSGEQKSPSPFDLAWVLGRQETLQRITNALNTLGA
ncbi:glutamate--tRNA ligase [Patescibacteria group bacterium]|nr:MAG: glutamate--tRNA ligase [Patescibacteria group bacterium]